MLLVHKYGGTSVGTPERIKNVAGKLAGLKKEGNELVVVVSAMGDTTDELIELAKSISSSPSRRELDALLSTGEQISGALMAMALEDLGIPAVSLTGWQAGIYTDENAGRARIKSVDTTRIKEELKKGKVIVVAGFQGICDQNDITTLGRGGSDTTAVALGIALGVEKTEIFTDVKGVYTADPRLVKNARKLDLISYEEMLELASQGARVMHTRAVELGWIYKMKIEVRSSFEDCPGTIIQEVSEMEPVSRVRGIAHKKDIAKITLKRVLDRPGVAHRIFKPLGDAGINVDDIIQNVSEFDYTDISFTIPIDDTDRALKILEEVKEELDIKEVLCNPAVGKVSIVGVGIQSTPGIAARMFGLLGEAGINIDMISTSEIKIGCIINEDDVERAVKVLHDGFGLGENS
ncbi:MAG TPA: aspartate kinase [bacterium]|nr:aspartate kinase [bacterium]